MDTTDNNESPKSCLEDRTPAATINWAAPGAPAVPAAPAAALGVPLRAVASMCVKPDGISVFPTPAAQLLEPGHYMLSVPGSYLQVAAPALPRPADTSGNAPTDLSKRMREAATAEVGYPLARLLIGGAEEIERLARVERAAAPVDIGPRWDDNGEPWNESAEKIDRDRADASAASGIKECTHDAGCEFCNWCGFRAAHPATASGDELPPAVSSGEPSKAEAEFTEWLVRNYPADTVIIDPRWHAPRIFRAATVAFDKALEANMAVLRSAWKERDEARAAVSAATKPTADLSALDSCSPEDQAKAEPLTKKRIWEIAKQAIPNIVISDIERFARAIEAELASRCRAQGGATQAESSGIAPVASADAVIGAKPDLEQLMMEKRIELVPEYEGEWRAYVYGDSDEPKATAAGRTPSIAVEAALRTKSAGAEGAAS